MATNTSNNSKSTNWLTLQTKFIDDNLDDFIEYLRAHEAKDTQDSFYQESIRLLDQRIDELLQEITAQPLSQESYNETTLKQQLRLLLTFCKVTPECTPKYRTALMAVIHLFRHMPLVMPNMDAVSVQEQLLQIQLQLLTCRSYTISLDWMDVGTDYDGINTPSAFFIRRLKEVRFEGIRKDALLVQKGVLVIQDEKIALAPNRSVLDSIQPHSLVLEPVAGSFNIYVDKKDRYSKTKLADYDELEHFVQTFMQTQQKCCDTLLKDYSDGDEVLAEVVSVKYNTIRVRTLNPKFTILEGDVDFNIDARPSHKNLITLDYDSTDFCTTLQKGQIIDVRIDSVQKKIFSLFEPLESLMLKDESVGFPSIRNKEVIAYATFMYEKQIRWVSQEGFILLTAKDIRVHKGDYAKLKVTNLNSQQIGATNSSYRIYADIVSLDIDEKDRFDYDVARRSFIEYLVHPVGYKPFEITLDTVTSTDIHLLISSLLLGQRTIRQPQERMHRLCLMRLLCNLVEGSDLDKEYLSFLQKYLKNLIHFTRERELEPIQVSDNLKTEPTVQWRLGVLEILQQCGQTEEDDLQDIINAQTDELLVKLARLVQSYNNLRKCANSAEDNIKSALKAIRHSIVQELPIDAEVLAKVDLAEADENYMGDENEEQEFKTSCVFLPKDSKDASQMDNIMRGVCAFMNRNGGHLYIGVNDAGNIVGVENDLKELYSKKIIKREYIDDYCRYISEQIKKHFGELYSYAPCQPYDGRVADIHITPCRHSIARFKGVPYQRYGASSREMTEQQMKELLSARRFDNEHDVENSLALQKAMDEGKQVILHQYDSTSSLKDRKVEAFRFGANRDYIWCYDIDKNRVATFKIARIRGEVEITNAAWAHQKDHKPLPMDIFGYLCDKKSPSFRIQLRLGKLPKLLLEEEFPAIQDKGSNCRLEPIDSADPDKPQWLFTTTVYNLSGIKRFCMGLGDFIEVVQGDELKKALHEAFEKGCSKFADDK